jgi:signal transduction histidine kinase
MNPSLRVRLPLAIGGSIGLSLVAFLFLSTQQVERELLRAADARAVAASDQLANLLAQAVQQQVSEVHRVAQDPDVRGYLEQPGDSAAERARVRLATLASDGQPAVELWDNAGQRRLLANPAKSDRPVPALPPTERPSADGISEFQAFGPAVSWTVVAAVPAGSPNGSGAAQAPHGFILSRRVMTSAANSDAISRLVGAGAIIKLGNVSGKLWSDLSRLVAAPAVEVRPGALANDRLADGQRLVGWATRIRGAPWIVLVEFPRSAVVAPARAFALRMLVVVSLLVLGAATAAYVISARITTPLGRLTHAAEAIAQGRFEEQVQTGRRDEIGRLAAAFQAMSTEVQAARQQLETRVEERTRAIAALNTQLESRVVELNGLSAELEAFSYSVSHDLRAPVRHIAGFTALLQKRAGDALDVEAGRYLRTIAESAARMGHLVDDLLAFSRMGRMEMLHNQVDLDELVHDVVQEVKHDATGRDIRWTTHPLPTVAGDRAMLRLAFTNLVSNAVKYTRPRQVAEIEIGAHPVTNGERVVYVRDNGVGFDMAYVNKLFGVFQRLHGADQFEGTGIGLANVRRIVQRHGGRAWAEGAPDHGATFFISLPSHERNRTA